MKATGPIVTTKEGTRRHQDRFELEWDYGANAVSISGNLYTERVSKYEKRGLVWGRGTGIIKLQRESIPALIALLSGYLAEGANAAETNA